MAVAERFLDSHCHLDFPEFANDLTRHLAEWRAQGVGRLVVPAVGQHNWARVSQLAARYDGVYAALGVHPYFAEQHGMVDVERLRAAIVGSESKIVAVGEIGLDASKPDMPHQRDLFIAQLALAQELDLPAIIHSFKTHSQILGDLRRMRVMRGVVHAFSGSQQDAARFVDQGMMLGVGAVITWSRATKTRAALADMPLGSLLLETDAPDMPVSGQARGAATPANLNVVFDALCALRREGKEEVAEALVANAESLFGLGG